MEPGLLRKGYALWLIPAGDTYRRLARTIRQLSHEYATPAFEPHVTLVSRIVGPRRRVLANAAQLAKQMPSIRLRLTGLGCRDDYFRCVIARVAPDGALSETHRLAKKAFGLRPQRPFLPHLSLVYGDLPPGTRRKIVALLGKSFDLEFDVCRLHVVAIQGAPRQWRRVKSFRLTSA